MAMDLTARLVLPAVDQVIALQTRILDPLVSADPVLLAEFLADDFAEIDASGHRTPRAQVLKCVGLVESPAGVPIQTSQMQGVMMSDDIVLLIYVATCRSERRYCSSLWRRYRADWKLAFRQATILPAHSETLRTLPGLVGAGILERQHTDPPGRRLR